MELTSLITGLTGVDIIVGKDVNVEEVMDCVDVDWCTALCDGSSASFKFFSWPSSVDWYP